MKLQRNIKENENELALLTTELDTLYHMNHHLKKYPKNSLQNMSHFPQNLISTTLTPSSLNYFENQYVFQG